MALVPGLLCCLCFLYFPCFAFVNALLSCPGWFLLVVYPSLNKPFSVIQLGETVCLHHAGVQ